VFLTAVMEQQVSIKFCVKLGKTPTETYEILQTVYGDEALNRNSVFEWFKQFKDGREDLQDDPRSRRPSTSRNTDTMENVREVVTRSSIDSEYVMLDESNINKETIHQILHEYLQKRNICAKFVSWMSRSSGDSHHARLVKTNPVFLIPL
jgi:hypothetical protein